MVLHLKRFDNFQRKIKKFVKYDNHLNLSKFFNTSTSGNKEEYKYKLFSVLVHEGFSINSGHYYCHVKNSNDMWYTMNDSWVSKTNEKSIMQETPYLLFYERVMDIKKEVNKNVNKNVNNLNEEANEKIERISLIKNENISLKKNENLENKVEIKKESTLSIRTVNPNLGREIKNDTPKEEKLIEPIKELIKEPTKEPIIEPIIETLYTESDYETSKIPINFHSKKRLKMRRIMNFIKFTKKQNNILNKKNSKKLENSEYLKAYVNLQETVKYIEPLALADQKKYNSFLEEKKFQASLLKKPNPSSAIYNRNLTGLYGSDNITLWETEDDSEMLKQQIKFMKSVGDFKEEKVLEKDEYDVDYDTGKLKKVKNLETSRNGYHYNYNVFQKVQNIQTKQGHSHVGQTPTKAESEKNYNYQNGHRKKNSDRDYILN